MPIALVRQLNERCKQRRIKTHRSDIQCLGQVTAVTDKEQCCGSEKRSVHTRLQNSQQSKPTRPHLWALVQNESAYLFTSARRSLSRCSGRANAIPAHCACQREWARSSALYFELTAASTCMNIVGYCLTEKVSWKGVTPAQSTHRPRRARQCSLQHLTTSCRQCQLRVLATVQITRSYTH